MPTSKKPKQVSEKESDLKRKVLEYLKQRAREGAPVWWTKLAGNPMQTRGLPDILVVYNGEAIFVELKTEKGKLTKLQDFRRHEIEFAGGRWYLIRSLEEFIEMFWTLEAWGP
jgi:hypothetical protein